MAKQKANTYNLNINELKTLSFSIEDEPQDYSVGTTFTFNLNVGHLVDRINKQIPVLTTVHVYEPDRPTIILSKIQVMAVYLVKEFDVIITAEIPDIPEDLRILLYGISISTTRGIYYSALKGTYLEKAILPIINPQAMVMAEVDELGLKGK
jgi:hypothetical protein